MSAVTKIREALVAAGLAADPTMLKDTDVHKLLQVAHNQSGIPGGPHC